MSYLDVPRIHFGGLFFTNPSTINNYDGSYDPSVPLTNSQGGYISDPPQGSRRAGTPWESPNCISRNARCCRP